MYCKNLSIYLKEDERYLIKDLSFSPEPGEKLALIGEEGNGKSTLLRVIYGEDVSTYARVDGELNRAREKYAYLPQSLTLKDLARSPASYFAAKVDSQYIDWNLYFRLLSKLALKEEILQAERSLASLSGGERIKMLLFIAALAEPDLYLLDEPSNDLDFASLQVLEKFIREVSQTVLFVSHDEVLLERCAESILHIEQLGPDLKPRQTYVQMPYADYVAEHLYRYERDKQLARKDQAEHAAKLKRQQRIYERVQYELRTVSRGAPEVARNLKDKMHSVKAQGRRFAKEGENLRPKPLRERPIRLDFEQDIDVPHASKEVLNFYLPELQVPSLQSPASRSPQSASSAGKVRVLARELKLQVQGVKKICIIGPNGCGKSTLLKQIYREMAKNDFPVSYMPQDYFSELDPLSNAVEFLTRYPTKSEHTLVRTYLGSLEFREEEMFRPLKNLSGGQLAKLYFAKMILDRSAYLILDEPSRNLSPLSGPAVRRALQDYPGGIIAVSHDRKFIRDVVDIVYRLEPSGLYRLSDAEREEI